MKLQVRSVVVGALVVPAAGHVAEAAKNGGAWFSLAGAFLAAYVAGLLVETTREAHR